MSGAGPVVVTTVAASLSFATGWVVAAMAPWKGMHDWRAVGTRIIWKVGNREVALTFDDGPHPDWTPRLLDLLAGYGVRATFFLVGRKAQQFPNIVRRIAREGHVIGNHTWSHATLPLCGPKRMRSEILRTQRTIEDIVGEAPTLIRPPYGRRDVRVYRLLQSIDLVPAMWSLDSRDWLYRQARPVIDRMKRVQGGDVVLLHDGHERGGVTVQAVRDLLSTVQRHELATVTLARMPHKDLR